jgi:Mg-chelatase subunit ChlD
LNLRVIVENQSDRPADGSLTLSRNGQVFRTESIRINPGSQVFSFQTTPAEGPMTSFQATFTAREKNSDTYPSDNRALAWVAVRSKAKVLLVNGHTGAGRHLEEILTRQGLEVTVRFPENVPSPAGYKAIIFNNAERERFPAGYFAAVEKHISAGNGFIMLGSDASFAPASFRQTAIERILPVEPREPPKREEKNRAVVLVIDKSGSMRDDNRIVYAKEAAKAVARQLRDIDLLGVVGFDDAPFVVVYLETIARLRGVVETQIDRLKPGGQTYFLPALIEARRQLERANATRKHLILLSDGVTRGSQGELVDLVSSMKNDSKITVSAVAISTEADVRIMKRLSQYGGGLFHHTIDPSSLPQIVLEQLQEKPKDDPQNEGPWTPIPDRNSELLAGLSSRGFPNVLGFMDTDPKRGARVDLAVQRQDRRLPLLASWRFGQGKAIALTMDLEGRWSRNWIPWNGLQAFWNRLLEYLVPPEENLVPAHEARVSFGENRSVLDLMVYEEAAANSQFRFSLSGKAKSDGTLTRLAPGHYQASLPVTEPGDYRIDILEDRAGRRIPFPPVGYSLAYSPKTERPRPEFNMRLLTRIAQATGGDINPAPGKAQAQLSTTKSYAPLKQPLIVLAFCLFLAEIAMRKFVYSEPD